MRIYFSCSLTGGRQDQPVYAALVQHLETFGHPVLTAHLANADIMAQDALIDAASVYARDVAWLEACEALIAEVTTPSHGVGIEIALAITLAKPTLCLHRAGSKVSKMITGCPSPHLEIAAYENLDDARAQIGTFLARRSAC
jgi:hypothetical protein